MSNFKKNLPELGLGLGLRNDISKETLDHCREKNTLIKWLEIVPENHIDRGGWRAQQTQEVLETGVQLIPHSVNLSIGSALDDQGKASFDAYLIQEMKELFQEIKSPWFSDHLSCTRIEGYYLQDLTPLPRIQESIETVVSNIKFLEDYFQLPFLIENPSFYSTLIEPEMSEADFLNQILAKADCGLLLDVNNIYVNATNHGEYKEQEFLDSLDLDRVVQVHIAGHLENYKSKLSHKSIAILDTHGEAIKEEVYKILEDLLSRTSVNAVLLERDSNFPDFPELIKELEKLDAIIKANSKRDTQLLQS